MQKRQALKEVQPALLLGSGGCWLRLIDDYEQQHLQRYTQMEAKFKQNPQVTQLLDYRTLKEESTDISEQESVED